mgnify:FL=1
MYRKAIDLRRCMVRCGDDAALEWLDPDLCGDDGFGWKLPSGMMVLANFSAVHALTLPSEVKMLLCSRADDDHNADSHQVPPESTVWYICR